MSRRHQYRNELGDVITRPEYAALLVQRVMRRWLVLGIVTAISIICWLVGLSNAWNLAASYWAIVVEQLTFMVVIGMARRDGVILRRVWKAEIDSAQTLTRLDEVERRILERLERGS